MGPLVLPLPSYLMYEDPFCLSHDQGTQLNLAQKHIY